MRLSHFGAFESSKSAMKIFAPEFDNLSARRDELSNTTEIPDLGEYAQEWADLAAGFERIGFQHSAESCRRRAIFYCVPSLETPGEYVRKVDGPFAELIPAE